DCAPACAVPTNRQHRSRVVRKIRLWQKKAYAPILLYLPVQLIKPLNPIRLVNPLRTNEGESKSLFAADKRLLFILLCLSTLLLLFIKISFIENETAAFEFLQDRPEGTVLRIINGIKYFSIPLVYLWKFTV